MVNIRTHGLKSLEILKSSSDCLPAELNAESLEHCVQKLKHMGSEQTSLIIMKAIKDHVEDSGASSESLGKVADRLSLKSNQELLIEAVALEKLKENAEQAEKAGEVEYIDQMIALLHLDKHERAFIRKWIDLGLIVCPKTRQTLAHTNLIPNFTVKALIANWCESNNVKLPDPTKTTNLHQPSSLLANAESVRGRRANSSGTPDRSLGSPMKSSISSNATQRLGTSPTHPRSFSEDSLTEAAINGNMLDMDRVSPRSSGDRSDHSGERSSRSGGLLLMSPSRNFAGAAADERLSEGHNRTNSASSTLSNSNLSQETAADGNEGASPADAYASDASGELPAEPQRPTNPSAARREHDFPSRLETRPRGQAFWRRPSERFGPRVVSSPTVEMRAELLEVEAQVKKLIEDLKSSSIDVQRNATSDIRFSVQENAVTALLNLSINDNNKSAIANADAIEPLIHVLETGSPEAKENSAATLFSLSVMDENKIKIGRSGAIKPLVDLLGNGTPRGKKDAATALFNLSINHENKARIVQAGAVKYLVELMDPAFGMVDKAVAVLSNLATIHEGRTAIGQEGGIPVLVEVVELGSGRGKENAAAALLQLCTNSNRFCNMVLQEGAVPPLVALSQSGTPRAREKAQQLLGYFRNQRHGNAGRG
ncbi:UNVERIFIED_CONTAM: U-box domain-containing protein 4 [Sesamum radiatum]|uniref:RING-type E3 ubiquitin transferase n=1 Tax=Sesamum radiatum TaxID=300843 RepID=A0AAW2JTR5_SESRA